MGHFITNADATRSFVSEGIRVAEDVTAAISLTEEDSEKDFYLNAAAGVQIDLPTTLMAGFNCTFTTGAAFATTDFTIVSATNIIQGGAIVNSVFVPAANENTISFVATAETLGDYVEVSCDGTNYYVKGVGAGAGSITFTAP